MFLLELRAIAARNDPSDTKLDPIFVFWSFLFGSGSDRFLIAATTANSRSGTSYRKDQHQEFARGVRHNTKSIPKQRSHIGSVWFFMAAGRPTGALLQKIRVVDVTNENVALYLLLLEVAFYAERRVTFVQQSLVNGPVR